MRSDYVGQPATLIHARAWSTGKNSQVAGDLALAREHGRFIGVDTERFPFDFSVFVRFHAELQRLRSIFPLPAPRHPNDAIAFLAENAERYEVEILDAR